MADGIYSPFVSFPEQSFHHSWVMSSSTKGLVAMRNQARHEAGGSTAIEAEIAGDMSRSGE
jgi:hypothetical protein